MGTVRVGIDIGQTRDPTAIAVVEEEWRTGEERTEDYYVTRYLERLPLGTPYPAVAARLGAVVQGLQARGSTPAVFVDATGVGQPVVDILAGAGVAVQAVYFTYGDRRTVHADTHTIT